MLFLVMTWGLIIFLLLSDLYENEYLQAHVLRSQLKSFDLKNVDYQFLQAFRKNPALLQPHCSFNFLPSQAKDFRQAPWVRGVCKYQFQSVSFQYLLMKNVQDVCYYFNSNRVDIWQIMYRNDLSEKIYRASVAINDSATCEGPEIELPSFILQQVALA